MFFMSARYVTNLFCYRINRKSPCLWRITNPHKPSARITNPCGHLRRAESKLAYAMPSKEEEDKVKSLRTLLFC